MTNGWQEVPLKEVAKPISRSVPVEAGTEYRTVGVKWWGMGAYERKTIDGSRTAAKTLSIVREGDLIINKIWVRHGSVAIAGKDVDGCAGSGEFPTFELDPNRIEPRWIHWQTKMKSFWGKCDSLSRGTSGKNRIKPELFLTIKIPLPPLDEQRRIVERIEDLASCIAKAQLLKAEAIEEENALFKSELAQLFNVKEPKFALCRLDEVAEKIEDIPHSMPKALDDGNKKLVSPKDFTEHGIDFSRCKRISEEDFQRLARKIQPKRDDILFSRIGTIGEARLVETDEDFIASYSIVTIRANLSILLPKFLLYTLQSPSILDQAKKGVRAIAMPDLGVKTIKAFQLPVPPLDEQRRIVAYLDSVQARLASLRELQSATGEELSALLPSVLDKAFKGEL